MALDQVVLPVRNATGGTYHGTVTAGGYKVQLWGYPQTYDAANGTSTPYLNAKKVTIIPSTPRFKMAHAAVPQLVGEPGQLPVQGEYIVGEYLDTRKSRSRFRHPNSCNCCSGSSRSDLHSTGIVLIYKRHK